jgi:hypothetical protein
MKFYKHYFYVIFNIIIVSSAACSTAPTNTTTNLNLNTAVVVNSNVANVLTANTATTPSTTASPLATNAASPSATINTYYQARVKKDEKAFRQALSKTTLTEFSANAQADGEKTLVGWLNGYSSPPKQAYETRNERISGDTALVEIKDSDTGLWSLTRLVRENGEWRMDLTSATTNSLLKQQPKQ